MSRYVASVELEGGTQDALAACDRVVTERGWQVRSRTADSITFREPYSLGFSAPVRMRARVTPAGQGARVDVEGSVFGIGPMRAGHVRGEVEAFVTQLRGESQTTSDRSAGA